MKSKNKILMVICICFFIVVLALLCFLLFFKKNMIANLNSILVNHEEQQEENSKLENTQINEDMDVNSAEEIPQEIQIYDIEEGYLTVPYNTDAIKHSYIWNNLSNDKSYYKYDDELYETKFGIDVSEYQGDIDWKKVKDSGVQFAFIRLGYRGYGSTGKLMLDSKFIKNVKKATENGIEVGIYFFSQAINEEEAKEEANYVLNNIKDMNITYPICFDLEKIKFDTARTDNLTSEEITKMTLVFCEEIKNAGYVPMIYGNSKTFTTRMQLEQFNNYQKWYADYQSTPLYPYDFTFWQYSEKGTVNGIDTKVDLNLQFVEKCKQL